MITKIFSVYDSKAQAYLPPFYNPAVGSAIRAFADAINDSQAPFAKHAGDYVLYQVGEFDDSTGLFTNTAPALHLGMGTDFMERKRPSLPDGVIPMSVPGEANHAEKA